MSNLIRFELHQYHTFLGDTFHTPDMPNTCGGEIGLAVEMDCIHPAQTKLWSICFRCNEKTELAIANKRWFKISDDEKHREKVAEADVRFALDQQRLERKMENETNDEHVALSNNERQARIAASEDRIRWLRSND